MAERRGVVLCADDFGLTRGVSVGILELAAVGRLSATSAMTNLPAWPEIGPRLLEIKAPLGVGLHLNLTSGPPLGPMPQLAPAGRLPPLGLLLRGAVAGSLPVDEVAGEIGRQLDAFAAVLGRDPDFVDGHQHVHALPRIRDALIEALQARGLSGRAWLRDPSDTVPALLRRRVAAGKALTVRLFAAGFARLAHAAGFETNQGFSGFSPFDKDLDVAAIYERAFASLGPRPLVMCHPGYADESLRALDPVILSRERELAYFRSSAFLELLERRGLELAPRPTGAAAESL